MLNARQLNTKKMVTLSMLSAISVILVMLIRLPWPGAVFLEYDFADVPILIATLIYGPCAGVLVTLVVSVIQGITVSASSGIIGIIMHILATGFYVLISGFIYRRVRNIRGLAVALIFGAMVSTLIMLLWNVWFTPIFMGVPAKAVVNMLVPVMLPFNLIKTMANGVIVFVLYMLLRKLRIV
ncbi:MAG: ECF transporter S component [Clostridia bacterium]|nr:ECF transporter S component [Clostridia bacterium]